MYYIKLILKMTISFKHNVTNMTIKNQHKIDNNKLQSCLHKKKGEDLIYGTPKCNYKIKIMYKDSF